MGAVAGDGGAQGLDIAARPGFRVNSSRTRGTAAEVRMSALFRGEQAEAEVAELAES